MTIVEKNYIAIMPIYSGWFGFSNNTTEEKLILLKSNLFRPTGFNRTMDTMPFVNCSITI